MESKKIIIISASELFREFFYLEAQGFALEVDCFERFERIHNDISNYDLAIIDRDTIKQKPLNTAKKEITASKDAGKCDITYPISIIELRKIYNGLFVREECSKDEDASDDSKIVFYKNEKNKISIDKRNYILSDTEYKILELLCRNSPKEILREDMQGLFENDNSNICDVYICKLRKKLEEPLGRKLIFTVRQRGYKIIIGSEWR